MDNIAADIVITLVFLSSIILGISLYLKNNITLTLFVIFSIGLLLRGYLAQDPALHEWDERYHALVAKNLVEHPLKPTLYEHEVIPLENTDWTTSHLWFSKPPFALWMMAGSIALFGNNEFAVRFPSLLFSLLGIYLTFLIGKELFNRRIGIIGAFLHAINGVLVELAAGRGSSDHVETMFIVMVELAAYLAILSLRRKEVLKWTVLTGLITGVAFLTKWFPAFLVFPIWFTGFILSDEFTLKKLFFYGSTLVLVSCVFIFPWILILNSYGDNILERVLFAFGTTVQGHQQPFWYYFNKAMVLFGELVFIPIFFAVYKAIKGTKKQELMILLVWILIPLILFSFGATKRYTYILISAPAYFIIIAYLVDFLIKNSLVGKRKVVKTILIIALLVLPLRYTVERLKLFQESPTQDLFYQSRSNWENRFDENDVVVGCPRSIELMFYTDVSAAYSFVPEEGIIDDLHEQGYNVYLYSSHPRGAEFILQRTK